MTIPKLLGSIPLNRSSAIWHWGMVLVLCIFSMVGNALAADSKGEQLVKFDHNKTGFILDNAHKNIKCEICHAQGIFKGTPKQCSSCHIQGGRIVAPAKPSNHIRTNASCDACHSTATFLGARFNHSGIVAGCASCHNGTTAKGKPSNHIVTTATCETCHKSTSTFIGAVFSHATVAPGTCATCHNGSTATGKPSRHIPTTASCDACHRTAAWIPATFSHATVAPGTCATCHNGSTATGKPSQHIPTTASCDACHRTTAWIPATFSHATVAPGTCATCHNGSTATGKPSNHFVTTRSCDACHRTTAWIPVTTYSHASPFYKAHGSGMSCNACHTGNSEVISWPNVTYKPDCAGCHAPKFKPDAHIKTTSPSTILYTVLELRDCAGSCHEYTDNTFTTVKTSRTVQHRPTDGGF